jgi:repressor LexA
MIMTLTKRQKEILDYISEYSDSRGYAPTLREICGRFALSSVATAHKHLAHLIDKGFLSRTPHVSRSLTPVGNGGKAVAEEVPLLGFIAAGRPIEAVGQNETISIPEDMLGKDNTYVLKVKGNSMIDEQIRDGDFVIVEERSTAQNGETVVALLNGEDTTLKKFYREGEQVRLQPANPEMEPIYVNERDITVQGVVIGILRKY